ncbi:hypothetical protein [Haloactinomyces albus]|uniref:ABC-type Fe3+ transport system permease subunit n=1 Tax=Haloactinomyces albus TaxID=1352928 RepID=A0AAE4CNS9_9ACTN|nr:hypothetical protein [Haloactinomyces albus]MDR7302367.1 ABC-type Fe3+ transport system permease subunit [Haloactinomyces albus]
MNASSSDRDDSAADKPPRVLRTAVGLWGALAVFLIVRAAVAWVDVDRLHRRLIEQPGTTPAEASSAVRSLLLGNLAIAVALAAAYAGLAWLIRQRHWWARIAVTVLTVAHLVMILGTMSLSASNGIVAVLALVAWACCWRAESTEWLNGER